VIENSFELSDWDCEVEPSEDELVRLALVAAWPGFVARASRPATSIPAAATKTSPRLTRWDRCLAAWMRDIAG
jgi:hypothetical protein